MLWVGIDVGGTFTDVVVYDAATGAIRFGKSPSTPAEPARGVLDALAAMGVALGDIGRFRHGATVATNTALERKGAAIGVVTTAGFRDVLIIGRGNRTKLYDVKAVRPKGLVERSGVLEVQERIGPSGDVLLPLDEAAVAAAAQRLKQMGAEAVAVCFLHSYANPDHEVRAAEILAEALPGAAISQSSEVLPEYREFERFATTALNAYVAPRMSGYLRILGRTLREGGLISEPEIMTSSGGSWPFERMARMPVQSMLSGPAGGVIGTLSVAAALGEENVIAYDMGGTSTDVCLIRGGRYELSNEGQVGNLPNRVPQIEINTIGAGGGSIAYLDVGGFLNVGPRSAGAVPGPACYGRGGTEPTVTDADVVLGRFRPTEKLGGTIDLDVAAAERAVGALATQLGLDRDKTADGIVQLAVTKMTGAIKEISVMRGIDPRDFALFAYGGAGPLHAALIAEELDMSRVIVPPLSGMFSAYGLLVADRRRDFSQTRLMRIDTATLADVEAVVAPMREAAAAELSAEGFGPDRIRFETFVDMRFVGQAFELTTRLPDDASDIEALIDAFHAIYDERYSQASRSPVEAVSFRLSAYGLTEKPVLPRVTDVGDLAGAKMGEREIRVGDMTGPVPIYRREKLPLATRIAGPAMIEEEGCGTLVPPGFGFERHATGALILTRGAEA